jgi:hypothetical protein
VAAEVARQARRAFDVLRCRDYAKFDVRFDEATGRPYFTDANPNTAFGTRLGLPLTEVLQLYDIKLSRLLASLMTKHTLRLQPVSQNEWPIWNGISISYTLLVPSRSPAGMDALDKAEAAC